MVTLVAEHWGTPESAEKGIEAFKSNTEKLKNNKGFVSRQVLRSRTDPYKYTTVTTFETLEDYESFMSGIMQRRSQRDPKAPTVFIGEKLEGYDVVASV